MAVQKSKKSRAKAKSRRAKQLSAVQLVTDPITGELTQRHHITPEGYYKGKQMVSMGSNEQE